MTRLHDAEEVVGYIPVFNPSNHVVDDDPDEPLTPVRVIVLILVALSLMVSLAFATMYVGAVQ